ncbi:MAG: HAD family phosphatase [Erysipelotrichaceae bacterium]|nr:HAD family phosphatase [Erysipelotrichaceae bacterium]
MIRNVIFDLDGTLLDSEYHATTIKREVLKRHGVEPTEELMAKLTAVKFRNVLPSLMEDKKLVEELMDDYYHTAYDNVDYSSFMIPGSTQLLRQLRDRGYTMALATISDREKVSLVIEQCGWQGLFSYVTTFDDVARPKPDPEIYLTVVQKLNLKKEETVVIEDSPVGIEAARRAGLMIICRREERLPLDQSGADWYVDDLSEIIGIIE